MCISFQRRAALVFALLILVCGETLRAQEQEPGVTSRMMNRWDHPDLTLRYEDADRKYSAPASVGGKQAAVRPFPFVHAASSGGGDGVFRTRNFDPSAKGYQTAGFASKTAAVAGHAGYSGTDKTYAVRAVAVHEDRAAGKTMNTRAYVNSDKPFLGRGKRQDTIDDMRNSKQMTIDQVRELLNKNN